MSSLFTINLTDSSGEVEGSKHVDGTYQVRVHGDLGGGTIQCKINGTNQAGGDFTAEGVKTVDMNGVFSADITGSTNAGANVEVSKIGK